MGTDHADAVPSDAVATVARQREEIVRLTRRIDEDRFAQDLRDAMTTASVTGVIGAPVGYRQLLKMIAATAADIVKAKSAWLFLIDAEQQYLVSEVAVGYQSDQAGPPGSIRVPLGEGIAGLVAQTGQPMAVSDSDQDDLDASDVGHAIGFNPSHILCAPLAFEDRIIGVLQFLDKDADDGFDVDDIEDVSLFGHLAAVAIEQSRTQSRMGALLAELVEGIDGTPDFDRRGLTVKARDFTAKLGQQTGYLDALELARLVHEVALHGDDATVACKGILSNFVELLRSRSLTAGGRSNAW